MRDSDSRARDWVTPGAFEVAPGVHRIPLPLPLDGLRAVNVYALRDGDGLVLIDAGWALDVARRRLEEALAHIGCDLGSVRRVLVTHAHRDHYTMATVVRRLFGARVAIGAHERDSLAGIQRDATPGPSVEVRRLYRYGASELAERLASRPWRRIDPADWEDPDEWLTDGTRVKVSSRTLEVIHTPGHTRGHVVFLDSREQVLFSGDHILPHITPSIGFERARPPLPLGDYLASLRLMLRLPDTRILPAHGPPGGSVHARSRELLEHHAQRLDEAAATIAAGARTAYEAAQLLTWTSRRRPFGQLDEFNQMLAVSETAAHLDLLVERGRLRSHVVNGVTHYREPPPASPIPSG